MQATRAQSDERGEGLARTQALLADVESDRRTEASRADALRLELDAARRAERMAVANLQRLEQELFGVDTRAGDATDIAASLQGELAEAEMALQVARDEARGLRLEVNELTAEREALSLRGAGDRRPRSHHRPGRVPRRRTDDGRRRRRQGR